MKNAKQKSTQFQYRIDDYVDVFVNGKFFITCRKSDVNSQQVQYLIKIQNGTIQQTRRTKVPQKK